MKFQYKIQGYQTDSVNRVVGVFAGQPYISKVSYIRDLGIKKKPEYEQLKLDAIIKGIETDCNVGFGNAEVVLSDELILENIREIQVLNNIKLSDGLALHLGRCSLDTEMEIGTGKTYVYIKSIFELYKHFGWSKFIVVVPSIAMKAIYSLPRNTAKDLKRRFLQQSIFRIMCLRMEQLKKALKGNLRGVWMVQMKFAFMRSYQKGSKSQHLWGITLPTGL